MIRSGPNSTDSPPQGNRYGCVCGGCRRLHFTIHGRGQPGLSGAGQRDLSPKPAPAADVSGILPAHSPARETEFP